MSEVSKLILESRKKLLDLTLRNTLLNYNLKRKNRIIIVDELPNVLYKHLLAGKKMIMEPIPYPEIDEEEKLKKKLLNVKHKAILIQKNDEPEEIMVDETDITLNDLDKTNNVVIVEENIQDIIEIKKDEEKIKELLVKFRNEVVSVKYKIDSGSILSNGMIDLLSRNQPVSLDEFRIEIPLYLREKIDRNQMEYIDKIFELIENNR